jgi:hypothetical protein
VRRFDWKGIAGQRKGIRRATAALFYSYSWATMPMNTASEQKTAAALAASSTEEATMTRGTSLEKKRNFIGF